MRTGRRGSTSEVHALLIYISPEYINAAGKRHTGKRSLVMGFWRMMHAPATLDQIISSKGIGFFRVDSLVEKVVF
jgi:hypothetical protein